eukprot:1075061-Pleurochrysis_carterae.AAC.17
MLRAPPCALLAETPAFVATPRRLARARPLGLLESTFSSPTSAPLCPSSFSDCSSRSSHCSHCSRAAFSVISSLASLMTMPPLAAFLLLVAKTSLASMILSSRSRFTRFFPHPLDSDHFEPRLTERRRRSLVDAARSGGLSRRRTSRSSSSRRAHSTRHVAPSTRRDEPAHRRLRGADAQTREEARARGRGSRARRAAASAARRLLESAPRASAALESNCHRAVQCADRPTESHSVCCCRYACLRKFPPGQVARLYSTPRSPSRFP